jgi:hypothetical protein
MRSWLRALQLAASIPTDKNTCHKRATILSIEPVQKPEAHALTGGWPSVVERASTLAVKLPAVPA